MARNRQTLHERHPYIIARKRFVAGEITREQAASMCAMDREWIAECDLSSKDPYAMALELTIRGDWAKEAVAAAQARKRPTWCFDNTRLSLI
jgi:hypothetical protein